MAVAAESAVRAWLNDPKTGLTDGAGGGPVSRGAYLRTQRSPADGAYVVLSRTPPGEEPPQTAEVLPGMDLARFTFHVYAGTEEATEAGAVALAARLSVLTGIPEQCGETSVRILAHDQLSGPTFLPPAPDTGEAYCFEVTVALLLADYANP